MKIVIFAKNEQSMLLKRGIYILLTLGMFSIFSCKRDDAVSILLTKAEKLVEHFPDSTLAMLQHIEAPEKLSDKQYALWCLLFTQAEDKKHIYHSSDSLIKIAVNYEKIGESAYLMKSYYYAAVIYHDIGDFPRAQEFYLKALDSAKKLNDYAFLGRIYSNLGAIYINIDLHTEALKFEKEALEIFSTLNDSTNIGIVLRNIGWIYAQIGQPDSGIIYYTKATSFVNLNDHFYIYNEIGSLYKSIGDYEKAFNYARLSQKTLSSNQDLTPVYHNIGSLYRLINQQDSATFYLSQCTLSANPYTRMGAYLNLAYLEELQQNWLACVKYQQQYLQLKDSFTQTSQIDKLQRIQSFFNYHQVEKERNFHEQDANKKKIYIYWFTAVFILIVFSFFLIVEYYSRIRSREKEKHEKTLRIERQKYLQTQIYLKEKEDKIARLEKSILLYSEKYNLPQKDSELFYLSPLYEKILNVNSNLKETDWEDLETWMDILFPGFSERLKVLHPTIDASELRLCYLKKINIPVKDIATALFITSPGVSHKWVRLYKKITGRKGTTLDMDGFMSDL